jgi:uncharacterized protein involved in exopolysaccharide biosynthesis
MEKQIDTIDIRALIGILRRQNRLIIMACILALGLAGLYLFQATPLYRANALFMIDPSRKNLLETTDPQMLNSTSESARIESEVAILKSDKVLLTTIERAGLISDPEFGPRLGLADKIRMAIGVQVDTDRDPEEITFATLKRLRDAVTAQRSGLTFIVSVGVSSESGEK